MYISLAYSLLIKIALVVGGFIQNIVLARSMNIADFGAISVAMSAGMLLGTVAVFGQQQVSLRYIPVYRSDINSSPMLGYYIYALLSIASVSAVTISIYFIYLNATGAADIALTLLIAAFPLLWAFSEYYMSALRCEGAIGASGLPRDVAWRLCSAIVIICVNKFYKEVNPKEVMLILDVTLFISIIFQVVYYTRLANMGVVKGTTRDVRTWVGVSLWVWASTSIAQFSAQSDTILVSGAVDSSAAGKFYVLLKVSTITTLFLSASLVFYAPKFSELYHSSRIAELSIYTRKINYLNSLVCVVVFGIMAAFPESVLQLFGGAYNDLEWELRMMAASYLLDALCGPVGIILNLCGQERLQLVIITLSAVAKAIAVVAAATLYGLTGAVVAYSAIHAVQMFVLYAYSKRRIGFDPSALGIWFHPFSVK